MLMRDSSTLARFSATIFCAGCIISPAKAHSTDAPVLNQAIPLPRVHGGFNHMSVDDQHHRLFAPAPADGMLEVVDLTSGKLWRSLPAKRPTTALYAPDTRQLYLTSGRDLVIYDDTLRVIASIDLHSRLDELQYDASARELIIGRMSPGETGIAIVTVPAGKLAATVTLPSSPQGLAIEPGARRLFVNLPDDGAVVVIDLQKRKAVATWKLKGASDNFPIALSEKDGRLFVATRTPAEMLAIDARTGRTIARVPCVDDADDMWYDAARSRIYISGGGGFLSVIQQQGPDRYRSLDQVRTAPHASNSTFSSRTKSLYIGVPPGNNQVAEIAVYRIAP